MYHLAMTNLHLVKVHGIFYTTIKPQNVQNISNVILKVDQHLSYITMSEYLIVYGQELNWPILVVSVHT